MGKGGFLDRVARGLRSQFVKFFLSEKEGHEGTCAYGNPVRNTQKMKPRFVDNVVRKKESRKVLKRLA